MLKPMASSPTPKGGPSTINGVLFQMLWSLLRAGTIEASCKWDPTSSEISSATLVLEPSNGGDLQIHSAGSREVEQMKTRTTGDSWSIKELVDDVLPDLYRAIDLSIPNTRFRFVTDGHCAHWTRFQDFIALLPAPSAEGVVAVPDTNLPVPLWKSGPATASTAFDEIVAILRQAKTVEEESPDETRRKTHHLLTRFDLMERQEQADVTARIDAWLDGLVPVIEAKGHVRDSLLLELVRRSAAGDSRTTVEDLCRAQGLDATPLHNWQAHHARASAQTNEALRLRGYDRARDVRPEGPSLSSASWPTAAPILILRGESGVGKTWTGFALLLELLARGQIALLVPSRGDVDGDTKAAAAALWQDVVGQDLALPLGRIRERLRKVGANQAVCFLFDGLSNHREAEELALLPWEKWRFYPILTCSPDVTEAVQRVAPDRVHVIDVPRFSPPELQRFLRQVAGVNWTKIPSGIADTLRLPLLASLYAHLAETNEWLPAHEYELYDRLWQNLLTGEQGNFPSDAAGLQSACLSFLSDGRYPWAPDQFGSSAERDARLMRLVKSGWLRPVRLGYYGVPHDRLLNWATATALVEELRSGRSTADTLCLRLVELSGRSHPQGQRLGYVSMDVLWQLLAPGNEGLAAAEKVVLALEATELGAETLYEDLLPTLGARGVPVAFWRLRASASADNLTANQLVRGLASVGHPAVLEQAVRDLNDPSPHVRRVAARLLAQTPTADALPGLWRLHCEQAADPAPFLQEWEQMRRYAVGQETMAALRAGLPMNPSWLSAAIRSADPSREPVHDLAYLLAGLPDAGTQWQEQKGLLLSKVSPSRERCLAMNILAHRDTTELDWLERRVPETADLLGAVAMRALAHLDPDRALRNLDRLPQDDLYSTRDWTLGELLQRRPEECCAWLLERLRRESDPWNFAHCLQGLENRISAPVLEFLLDGLPEVVDKDLESPRDGNRLSALYHPLDQLLGIRRADLLACFRDRRDGPLAQALTRWLAVGSNVPLHDRMKSKVLDLLARIGGREFSARLTQSIESNDRFERLHAYRLARRQVSPDVLRALERASLSPDLWDGRAIEQGFAATALAAGAEWKAVITYIVQYGAETHDSVTDHGHAGTRLDDAVMAPAMQALEADGMTPGVAVAFAFGCRREYLPQIRETLRAEATSPKAVAYVVALRWLEDSDPSSVDAIRNLLINDDLAYQAVNALFENASDQALDTLMARAEKGRDASITYDLLGYPRTRERALRLLGELLGSPGQGAFMRTLEGALSTPNARDDVKALIRRGDIRDFLHGEALRNEGSSWRLAEKATAIRGLSEIGDPIAFEAARAALLDTGTPDRWEYPYLLAEIDPDQALRLFLDHAQVESTNGVLWAMSRAMTAASYEEPLRIALLGPAASRRAASRLAARLPPAPWLLEAVAAARDDSDSSVALAADKAATWLRNSCWAEELSKALVVEPDRTHAWTLLEALLHTGDPGDPGQPLPPWASSMKSLPLAMRQRLGEGLQERRRKMADLGRKREVER